MRICQSDSSITTESLNLKYDNLLEKYNQLQASHKSLEENYEVDKTNSAKAISTLKSQYDKVVQPNKNKKILKAH